VTGVEPYKNRAQRRHEQAWRASKRQLARYQLRIGATMRDYLIVSNRSLKARLMKLQRPNGFEMKGTTAWDIIRQHKKYVAEQIGHMQ
jgi:hypothetical protein